MLSELCTTGCTLPAWHACEECHRPYCFTHARFLPREVTRGRSVMIEFALLCYDCQPETAAEVAEDGWSDCA